jgi:hypothetical protein
VDFCPIVPTSALQKYLSKRKTWFALAQRSDPTYQKFYRYRPDDVTLILDNGSYEGEMRLDEYTDAIDFYKPQVVVLPDLYLGEWNRSLNLSLGFLEQCGLDSQTYSNEWMFVPQAKPGDAEGFQKAAQIALQNLHIKWIGIPRCLTTDIVQDIDAPIPRIDFALWVKKTYPFIKVHALGMINGCIPELYYLQKAGVRSCDSSWPFNHGDTGLNLEAIDKCLTTP